MNQEKIAPFYLIGISVRTTNENNQSGKDIPALWKKFMEEKLLHYVPNKISDTLYCVYTDYEYDYTAPYTAFLGCAVSSLQEIPAGFTGKSIDGGIYQKFNVKGNIIEGIVYKEWEKIWNSDIARAYTADFEVYGDGAKDPLDASVDIFIAIK